MTPDEIAVVRGELEAFAAEVSEPFARKDQRRWGQVYLQGLLTDGQRKSVEPMAARLGEDGNRQALANFITTSPWDPAHIRAQLAWRGQVGVSLHLARDHASAAVNWRLFLPQSWDPISPKADADKIARRAPCGIPEDGTCPRVVDASEPGPDRGRGGGISLVMKVYSPEFKADAVALYLSDPGHTFEGIGKDLGISRETLRNWVRAERARHGRGSTTSTEKNTVDSTPTAEELQAENAALRRELAAAGKEIQKLATERDILRKATKFFAQEMTW